jgi:hypothetical protein
MHFNLPALLILFLAMGGPALGGGPPRGDKDFEVMTYAPGNPRGCVGNPVTPLCAIMTKEACEIWSEASLCRAVGYTTVYLDGKVPAAYAGLAVANIRIIEQRVLTQDMIPPWTGHVGAWVHPDEKSPPWRAGDLAARIEWWVCSPDDKCVTASRDDPTKRFGEGCPPNRCGLNEYVHSYVLRREDRRWRVLYTHFDPDDHGDFWNAFWKRK